MIIYLLVVLIFFIGLYGIVAKKNIIKIIVGINIVGYAINLLFIVLGYKWEGMAPVLTRASRTPPSPASMRCCGVLT